MSQTWEIGFIDRKMAEERRNKNQKQLVIFSFFFLEVGRTIEKLVIAYH